MKKYVAKKNTWFLAGSACKLICEVYEGAGLFCGLRVCEDPAAEGGHPEGACYEDEEVCPYDEFEISE